MNQKNLTLLMAGLVAAALLGAVLLPDSYAQNAPKAQPAPVAVCDVVEVFNNYKRSADLKIDFDKRKERIEAENKKRLDAIDMVKGEMEGFTPGTKDYEERFEKLQRLSIERQAWLKYQEFLASKEQLQVTEDMYRQIRQAIETIARKRGFDVVLYRERKELPTESMAELLNQIERRKVLYFAESVDITEDVLTEINRTYAGAGR